MKKINPFVIFLLFISESFAQVGINNTNPQATLDITVSNLDAPAVNDGILVPRINNFPATSPGEDQDGMLVFVTGVGTPEKGFYFWNNDNDSWGSLAIKNDNTSSFGSVNDLIDAKSDDDGTDDGSSIFIGINAGAKDNEANNCNISMGYNSLSENTSGNKNLAIGYRSMLDNISGTHNVALGFNTLLSNVNGTSNTAIGSEAMEYNTQGFDNTCVGFRAGNMLTNGKRNVFIGSNTGFKNATGSDNVFIGYNAGYNEEGNKKLYIENSNTTSPLIYGDFDEDLLNFNAQVGINIQPEYDLHIKQTSNSIRGSGGIVLERAINSSRWKLYHSSDGLSFSRNNVIKGTFLSGTGEYVLTSDKRLKKNISFLPEALPQIKGLKAYQYVYKDQENNAKKSFGFIAQEVQNVFPELVKENGNGYLGITYSGFSVLAIKAIQEQQFQIEQQQEHINKQKQEIKLLKNELKKFINLEKRILALERKG